MMKNIKEIKEVNQLKSLHVLNKALQAAININLI